MHPASFIMCPVNGGSLNLSYLDRAVSDNAIPSMYGLESRISYANYLWTLAGIWCPTLKLIWKSQLLRGGASDQQVFIIHPAGMISALPRGNLYPDEYLHKDVNPP